MLKYREYQEKLKTMIRECFYETKNSPGCQWTTRIWEKKWTYSHRSLKVPTLMTPESWDMNIYDFNSQICVTLLQQPIANSAYNIVLSAMSLTFISFNLNGQTFNEIWILISFNNNFLGTPKTITLRLTFALPSVNETVGHQSRV